MFILATASLSFAPRAPHLPRLQTCARRFEAPPAALAPSGVDGLPLAVQAGFLGATFVTLGSAAHVIDRAYGAVRRPDGVLWDVWEIGAALLLGLIFVTAGRSHFTVPEAFTAIYPPQGTWGLWYLPGSAEFHVAWTGVAEIGGGSGLLTGAILDATRLLSQTQQASDPASAQLSIEAEVGRGETRVALEPKPRALISNPCRLRPVAARALFVLVLCVTPANFFMFSHGATMPGVVEGPLPMQWHLVRFLAQVSVLSVLLTLSELQGLTAGRSDDDNAAESGVPSAPR